MREENRLDKDTQQDTAQLLQMAKEKLRWYTLEASEEEFDENAVDALVNLIAAMEQKNESPEDEQKELERFHAYCEFYEQEEVRKRGSANNEEDSIKSVGKKPHFKEKAKKFPKGRRLGFVAAAAGILLMIAVGGTGAVRAGEDSGFFVWLRKDGEGVFGVTSQSEESLEVDEKQVETYDNIENIPLEYKQYIVEKEQIELLKNYEFSSFEKYESVNVQRFMGRFYSDSDRTEVSLGVCIYHDMLVLKEEYDDYKLLCTNYIGEKKHEVFLKKAEAEETDYFICFYVANKKYFVQGNDNIIYLENICKEYMEYICKNQQRAGD